MAIKLTLIQVTDLLTKAGVPHVEIVDKEEESDYIVSAKTDAPVTADSLLVAIDSSREAIIAPKILHAKTGELQSTIAGKLNGSLRSQISQLTGIPTSDIKEMDSKDAMKAGLDYYAKSFGDDKAVIKQEMDGLMSKHADNLKQVETQWSVKLSEATNKLTEKEVIAQLVKDHNEAKGLPPSTNKEALAKQYKNYLDSKAIVKFNEEKQEVELYDKANPDIRLYQNDSKVSYAKPADLMKPFYEGLGLWNEDNRTINPADELAKTKTSAYQSAVKNKDGEFQHPVSAGNEAWANYASDAIAQK